jgi:Ser/Thr protein kinase RdoA (MazF antagonist)
MHADSIGQIERFERLAYPLHPQAAAALADPSRLIAEFRKLQTQLEGMISVETSFESELMAVITAVTAPGPFFTYIHGDPCPDNIFYNGDSLRLIDFEFGRFGSALLDAVYGRMTFPTCWCANRLPVALIHRLERAYRTELSRNCPAAQDDALFEAALVDACAYWLFVTLSWLFESALREDSQWGISTVRPRILARLEVFVTTAEQFRQRPALRRVVERLLDQLRRQWADTEPLPLYPAFRPSAD